MAKKVRNVVTGHRAIDAMMAKLERKLQTKIVRDALRTHCKPMVDYAKSLVPVDSGALRKAIKLRAGTRSRKYIRMAVVVGSVAGKRGSASEGGLYRGKTFYGGFVEYGLPNYSAKYPRQQFMRPTYDHFKRTLPSIVLRAIRDQLIAATRGK